MKLIAFLFFIKPPIQKLAFIRDQFNYRVGGIKSFLLSFIHGNGNTTTPLTARRVI
ncbi:MAG: hypothetical protein HN778_19460 [Prolixibacteraceae bacterium]|nr:hypothetical protein [Prolixibacteraceae bacterium]MBT7397015.1 hypothetical protein [Prolixibacteraceae bacterium]